MRDLGHIQRFALCVNPQVITNITTKFFGEKLNNQPLHIAIIITRLHLGVGIASHDGDSIGPHEKIFYSE